MVLNVSAAKGKNGWRSIWAAYYYRAKQKGFTWEFTEEQFNALLKLPCEYCGSAPTEANGSGVVTVKDVRYFYNGIDRVDNRPIYSVETTVPCCARCNLMKGTKTREEFISHVSKIKTHTDGKNRA